VTPKRRPQGAGGIRERNGRWQSSTRDPRTGRTLWRTWPHGTTRRQAEQLHREWLAEVGQRRPADRTLTVAGYLASWLDVRVGERQGNPDVAAQPPDVTALHERLSRLEAVVFPDDPTRWVPLSRASQLTGIPHRTLNHYAATERCPAHKFRGQWYVDPTWVASQAAQRPKAGS